MYLNSYKRLFLLWILALTGITAIGQPAVLGTQAVNGTYSTYNLSATGLFRQARVQATSSAFAGTRNWEFTLGTAATPVYTTNWRPYTAGQTISGYNVFIDPATATASARYNTSSGGQSGLMPAVTAGNFYTFDISINAAINNYMSILETSYNPVTINTLTATTPLNTNNSVLVTITTSALPNSGENFFVRYSTDNNFTTSTISQCSFNGTTATALIPCFPGGTTVYYYAFSSNKTAVQLNTDALINQSAYDMGTLNIINNGGPNYSYVQGSGTNFGGIYLIPSACFPTLGSFVSALDAGTVTTPVTCYAIGGSPVETAPAGGISITQTGTASNPVIIKRFGSGNYSIQASSSLSAGVLNDAIIKLIGSDYITIDGLTLLENPSNTNTVAASNNMTEWGIALLYNTPSDGCQNNNIVNNNISLNRAYTNSFGIYSNTRHTALDPLTVADITNNTTAPNSFNLVYNNTISNVNAGICFIGSAIAANMDSGNDVGGNSAATGNTISNWGTETSASLFVSNSTSGYAILMNHQLSDRVSYNTISPGVMSALAPSCSSILKDYSVTAAPGSFTSAISNNTITGLLSSAASSVLSGILVNGGSTVNINDNAVSSIIGSGNSSPQANGISISGGANVNIFRNKVFNIQQSGNISTTSPAVNGLLLAGGTIVTAYNNFISDLKTPNASLTDAIRGVSVTATAPATNYNLYYNSVYLNAVSGGALFGSTGVYHTTNTIATSAALNMTDNIIVNTSAPAGGGITAAYRRSDATLSNFAAAADYNLYYAGTPSPNRLIYYDGTNANQSLAVYQVRVSPREANSISTMPGFISPTDLHLTSANCAIDGRGIPVGGITADIDAELRDMYAPDMGADEFSATGSNILAATAGGPQVNSSANVSPSGTFFIDGSCNLVAKVLPSGANPVTGMVKSSVIIEGSVANYNGEPYVQRHYDIAPVTANTTNTSATITLYFLQSEFDAFNAVRGSYPALPSSPSDPAAVNLRVTQYHGLPAPPHNNGNPAPGYYTGTSVYIVPSSATWNATYLRWEVSFPVTGFSGFYVHSNTRFPLNIAVNWFTGSRQGGNHLLNWKVTCSATPRLTMTLERSAGAAGSFLPIYSLTAAALRCNQPFDFTDSRPLPGMNYYRLKLVDADGRITYSNIVALLNAVKGVELLGIMPNPVPTTGAFKLNIACAAATAMELVTTDMQGRVVDRRTISLAAGFNSIEMYGGGLAAGSYTICGYIADLKTGVIRFVKD